MTNVVHNRLSGEEMERQLQEAVEQARSACSISGDYSSECAVAWDTVEELQAAAADRRFKKVQNSLEEFCSDHPDASECRIYDV